MHHYQNHSQFADAPRRWRAELLTAHIEERTRQIEDDYRRAFDTHLLDEAVQRVRRPRLSPAVILVALTLGLVLTPTLQSWSGPDADNAGQQDFQRPTP